MPLGTDKEKKPGTYRGRIRRKRRHRLARNRPVATGFIDSDWRCVVGRLHRDDTPSVSATPSAGPEVGLDQKPIRDKSDAVQRDRAAAAKCR